MGHALLLLLPLYLVLWWASYELGFGTLGWLLAFLIVIYLAYRTGRCHRRLDQWNGKG